MSNIILNSIKYIIFNNKISNDLLKIRELEAFLDSEFNEYSFDFRLKGDDTITYKKIVPINSERCEVKTREIRFRNNTITLEYDGRNVTNLLRNVDDFFIKKKNNLILIDVLLGDMKLTKTLSIMSYDI